MVPAERTVTVGVGHGKKAARYIDGWLRGAEYEPPPKHELATFDKLNTWYYGDAPRAAQPHIEAARRGGNFDEVVQGSTSRTRCTSRAAACPAARAFRATTATASAPNNAVIKLGDPGSLYEIDLDFCKGCGMCVSEYPSGAIKMEPETI